MNRLGAIVSRSISQIARSTAGSFSNRPIVWRKAPLLLLPARSGRLVSHKAFMGDNIVK